MYYFIYVRLHFSKSCGLRPSDRIHLFRGGKCFASFGAFQVNYDVRNDYLKVTLNNGGSQERDTVTGVKPEPQMQEEQQHQVPQLTQYFTNVFKDLVISIATPATTRTTVITRIVFQEFSRARTSWGSKRQVCVAYGLDPIWHEWF